MSTLILLRHGQSLWNLENKFAGWSDIPLTERGQSDAVKTAEALKSFHFDLGFTSRLQRAATTLDIILKTLGQKIPITVDSALNERHYGDLQGLNKAAMAEKYGQEQVLIWRRSYSVPPPNGESIAMVKDRVLPLFKWMILPEVHAGKNVIVTASGNSLRPILQLLDGLDDETTASMDVGLCTPYVYEFEGTTMKKKYVIDVPGIVTKGASQTETIVKEGRV
jgi:2,3-bisphosphoglycerate-dependent phosphoglycerate mutase